ncbi:MAG: glycosyltransferase [Phycisphaerales bacterium]|nr:glycosyltransferase [Phycisphaerales bacterium]
MRILMLGWEFPPFIAGGLGVACYGLTRALDKLGHYVTFVLPKQVDRSQSSHVKLLTPEVLFQRVLSGLQDAHLTSNAPAASVSTAGDVGGGGGDPGLPNPAGFEHTRFVGVPAAFSSPYPAFGETNFIRLSDGSIQPGWLSPADAGGPRDPAFASPADLRHAIAALGAGQSLAGAGYGSDLIGDSERYARLVVAMARGEDFDVVHAHDWLTYPAGLAIARVARKPLAIHVHSTEFDRSGNNINQRIYDIERAGMHGADRVLAVSMFTKSICVRRYGVNPAKIDVIHNGIERESQQPQEGSQIESKDKLVLFLGRITMQKGPEYFIAAAKRVLEKIDNVKFVVAGSGDMALRMVELAASMGIGHKVLFTGFLRGRDVERVFQMADCYVMPSVSEPFGLAALEAIHHDVPVIVSKTSGVSEVLQHVLKVDFWDIDEMANKIVAVLKYPPLSQTLREHGTFELHRLTWDGAAERCIRAYHRAGVP